MLKLYIQFLAKLFLVSHILAQVSSDFKKKIERMFVFVKKKDGVLYMSERFYDCSSSYLLRRTTDTRNTAEKLYLDQYKKLYNEYYNLRKEQDKAKILNSDDCDKCYSDDKLKKILFRLDMEIEPLLKELKELEASEPIQAILKRQERSYFLEFADEQDVDAKEKDKPPKFHLIPIVLCFAFILSVFDMPYGFYQFMRIIVFIFSLVFAFLHHVYSEGFSFSSLSAIVIAILWNPLYPIYLQDKDLWITLDVIAAVIECVMTISSYKIYKNYK